jgi:hypothetical protein
MPERIAQLPQIGSAVNATDKSACVYQSCRREITTDVNQPNALIGKLRPLAVQL